MADLKFCCSLESLTHVISFGIEVFSESKKYIEIYQNEYKLLK